ncbi:light-inducible protein CPRF2 [Carica papaya]|uniref:light-inducible protein CPRF2 n=1 Tax=Carica papaya TaxID=3649 RepID=UPI000B8C7F21|nr:light-inducible protein CPRF2 [Carica papaya]
MDRVFSVEEISGQLWSSSPAQRDDSSKMNRSASEWAFQRFLQEAAAAAAAGDAVSDSSAGDDNDAVLEIEQQSSNQNQNLEAKEGRVSAGSCSGPGNGKVPFNAPPPPNVSIDSEDYQAFLKNKLNLACAAVALSRASFLKLQDSATRDDSGAPASNTSQLGSQDPSKGSGYDLSRSQDKDANGSVGMPSLPAMQKKPAVPSPSDTSADPSVPVQDDSKHHFFQSASTSSVATQDLRVNNGLADISSVETVQPNSGTVAVADNKIGRTASMQRVASLEHLQKRIRGGVSPCGPQSNGEQ